MSNINKGLPLRKKYYGNEYKNDFEIIYSLDEGDVFIEQANGADKEHYCFNSWGCEAYLDNTTVAIFRIIKFKQYVNNKSRELPSLPFYG